MAHVPVLVFETDPVSSELLDIALTLQRIQHFSCLVPLEDAAQPCNEYFRDVLEERHPQLLITSWREIGTVVRFAERNMAKPRPVEKWIVSSYPMQTLENHKATTWADEAYRKPISAAYLAGEIERCLRRIQMNFQPV